MTKIKFSAIPHPSWDISFWFAVLSPALGVLVGFIALLLFYR